ncbi:MAG: YojF family protein [Bacillota bacterium]
MKPIVREEVQAALNAFTGKAVYLHLETTNGAYAGESAEHQSMAVCAYVRNAVVRFHRGVITGAGPYRAGLQMEQGWIYAEGLTDFEVTPEGRLLLAGHDAEGRLAVALQLSETPFPL